MIMAHSSFALDLVTALWSHHLAVLLLKATLILVAAFGISVVLQRASAGTRHLVWLVALGTLLVAPILIAWTPLEIHVLPAIDMTTVVARTGDEVTPAAISPRAPAATEAHAPARLARIASAPRSASMWPTIVASAGQGALVIAAVWASGVLLVLGGLGWSLLVVRRIVRAARPLEDPVWGSLLVEAADRLGLDETPRLVVARETHMPFGCGVFVPTIVLPETSHAWNQDRRRAVLLHELAHVRRRDLVGHMLGRIACAAYWFHPLVWMAAKRLRTESERACDDLAVTSGTHAADYAEHLLDIVTAVRAHATPVAALAMARRNEFEGRMLAILDPELPHTTPSRGQSSLLIAGLVLSAGLVAAAAPVRRAHTVAPVRAQAPIPSAAGQVVPATPTPNPTAPESRRLAQEPLHTRANQTTTVPSAARVPTDPTDVRAGQDLVPRSRIPNPESRIPSDSQSNDERPALLAKVLRTDSSAELRRVAAWGLQDYDHSQVAEEALVAAVQHDADARVREMAAWALGSFDGHQEVVGALAAAVHSDAAEEVRETATWALGQAGDEDAADALTAALGDASAAVRLRAAWGLGNVGPKHAPQALIGLLRDHDPETRRLAAWALFQIQDPSALPALETALHSESDKDVQMAELRAVAVMGDKAVDVLSGLLESKDPEIRSMAIRGLAGGDAAGPWPWPWPEPRPNP